MPEIIVEVDFDGYFENLTRQIIARARSNGHEFKFKKVTVTAGPWRSVACSVNKVDNNTVNLDFYSALRTGFGIITDDDLAGIGKLL
jgi:hypothetical protein